VGEATVAGKMMDVNAVIGGEGNGGLIDLRVGPVRDSFLAIAMTLDLMTRTGKTISQLVAELPRYAMLKTKFECTRAQADALVVKAKNALSQERIDTQDGVRVDFADGWVHVRPSNTEPIARVIAEAKTPERAQELVALIEALK
jgi:phosphomannomutase